MGRALHTPHQALTLAAGDNDTIALFLCDESTLGDGMLEEVSGNNATDAFGGTEVAGGLFAVPQGSTGARVFTGTEYQTLNSDNPTRAALVADDLTFEAWVRPDALGGTQVVLEHGAAGETEAANILIQVAFSGSELRWLWETGAGTNVSGTTSGAAFTDTFVYHVAVVRRTAASGTADKVDVDVFVNGGLYQQWTDQDAPSGGTLTNWTIAANVSGGDLYEGAVDDIRLSSFAAEPEAIRETYAAGIRDFDEAAVLDCDTYASFDRVRVLTDNGWVDLSNLRGVDFVHSIEDGSDTDDTDAYCTVTLFRRRADVSVAPMMDGSVVNAVDAGGTLLTLRSRVLVESAVVPEGWAFGQVGPHWRVVFDGVIGGYEPASNYIDVRVVTAKTELHETFIEPDRGSSPPIDREYGSSGGTAVEGELQDIIDDNEPAAGYNRPQLLYTPSSPGWNVLEFVTPPTMTVGQELDEVARSIGWLIKTIWDDRRKLHRLTFYEPDRATGWTSGDLELTPDRVLATNRFETDFAYTRNAVEVEYGDSASTDNTGTIERATVLVEDAASIAKWGRRYCRIGIATTDRLNNVTQATELANNVLSDLKDPLIEAEVDIRYNPTVELHDMARYYADNLRLDSDIDLAVVGYRHRRSADERRTTLTLRGAKPAGHVRRWFDDGIVAAGHIDGLQTRPPDQPTNLTVAGIATGLAVAWDHPANRGFRDVQRTEVHVSTSNGFTPSSSTLVAVADTNSIVIQDLDPEQGPYYVKVLLRDSANNVSAPSAQAGAGVYFTAAIPRFRARVTTASSTTYTTTPAHLDPTAGSGAATEDYDVGANLAADWTFTAPVDGQYRFSVYLPFDGAATGTSAHLYADKGSGYALEIAGPSFAGTNCMVTGTIDLRAGDTVRVYAAASAGSRVQLGARFEGELIGDAT